MSVKSNGNGEALLQSMREVPAQVVLLEPTSIKPFPKNPRKRFFGIAELLNSIKAIGQQDPIKVMPSVETGWKFELVDGERRLRACLMGGIKIRAFIEPHCDDRTRLKRSVAANCCRESLDAMETAHVVMDLLSDNDPKEIAALFGRSRPWVYFYKNLMLLDSRVQEMLRRKTEKRDSRKHGKLTPQIAQMLVPLSKDLQWEVAQHIQKHNLTLESARRYIIYRSRGALGEVPGRSRSDFMKRALLRLAQRVDRMRSVAGEYLDMPGAEWKALQEGSTSGERKALAEELEKLTDELLQIGDALSPK
jgi:ParB/RepB/Spo0J family partition protein